MLVLFKFTFRVLGWVVVRIPGIGMILYFMSIITDNQ